MSKEELAESLRQQVRLLVDSYAKGGRNRSDAQFFVGQISQTRQMADMFGIELDLPSFLTEKVTA